MPDDFTPTEGGEVLEFGETAHVVTTGFDTGQPLSLIHISEPTRRS